MVSNRVKSRRQNNAYPSPAVRVLGELRQEDHLRPAWATVQVQEEPVPKQGTSAGSTARARALALALYLVALGLIPNAKKERKNHGDFSQQNKLKKKNGSIYI